MISAFESESPPLRLPLGFSRGELASVDLDAWERVAAETSFERDTTD
jgi:hypothetical protein